MMHSANPNKNQIQAKQNKKLDDSTEV
jgi:hypothetical protein